MLVDLVGLNPADGSVQQATEIKWSDRAATRPREELATLIDFSRRNNARHISAYVKTEFGQLHIDGIAVAMVPLSVATHFHGQHFADAPILAAPGLQSLANKKPPSDPPN